MVSRETFFPVEENLLFHIERHGMLIESILWPGPGQRTLNGSEHDLQANSFRSMWMIGT